MADELIDICDENNILLGVQKLKSEAHKKGLWHRAVHIWIYSPNGEVLVQLRAHDKLLFPDKWDVSVAGHISAGDEPVLSALREIKEEIGLTVKKEELEFFNVVKQKQIFRDIKNNEFYYIYFLKFKGDIKNWTLQKEEVQKIKFMPLHELEMELKSDYEKFVPHGQLWHEIINEIKKRISR